MSWVERTLASHLYVGVTVSLHVSAVYFMAGQHRNNTDRMICENSVVSSPV